jgi:hypothetical protein
MLALIGGREGDPRCLRILRLQVEQPEVIAPFVRGKVRLA